MALFPNVRSSGEEGRKGWFHCLMFLLLGSTLQWPKKKVELKSAHAVNVHWH